MAGIDAVVITGPTATGKSGLAAVLVDRFGMDLISCDSGQVYRGCDIGTAKPGKAELAATPHALIDIRDPWQRYSAADYARDAGREIRQSIDRGRIPLIVGGTLFYLHALLEGLDTLPSADAGIRERISREAGQAGWPAMHARLAREDPAAAARIDPNDRQRLQRALELLELGAGAPRTHSPKPVLAKNRVIRLCLCPSDRRVLHRNIDTRYRRMIEAGLVGELEKLLARPEITRDSPALGMIGYRQLLDHVTGGLTLETAVERAVAATRQFAKRQLTWLRNTSGIVWFDTLMPDLVETAGTYIDNRLD